MFSVHKVEGTQQSPRPPWRRLPSKTSDFFLLVPVEDTYCQPQVPIAVRQQNWRRFSTTTASGQHSTPESCSRDGFTFGNCADLPRHFWVKGSANWGRTIPGCFEQTPVFLSPSSIPVTVQHKNCPDDRMASQLLWAA